MHSKHVRIYLCFHSFRNFAVQAHRKASLHKKHTRHTQFSNKLYLAFQLERKSSAKSSKILFLSTLADGVHGTHDNIYSYELIDFVHVNE